MTCGTANSFVVFPIGRKHFALPASLVSELAQPDTPQVFPHTTPLLIGVLVRRRRIVPVCDVAQVLIGPDAPARKFYLIATRASAPGPELIAIPVTGECELVTADMLPARQAMSDYVTGIIVVRDQSIEVVDLEKIMKAGGAEGITMTHAAEVPA
jgi:chemotaxis signal transduction protein